VRRAALFALPFLLLALGLGLWLARNLEGLLNRVEPAALPEVSERAALLHRASTVVDLHADSLLFGRDLARRSSLGHLDLPRLREGGVALQLFGVVTRVPFGVNIDRNEDRFDLVTPLACLRWLPECTASPFERLERQAARLADLVARDGDLVWIRTREDLTRLLERRRAGDRNAVGVMLTVEGAHALEGDPANLERAFALGVRAIGLTHFFDDAYAGSAHGADQGGLSELGRRTVARMEELGIALDLAHLSPAAIDDALALATKPVIVSHGGARGTCDNARTLTDDQLRAIAAGGGVVGIGYWETAVCGTSPRDVARAIRYVADLVGDEHVALGSDYDGATTVGFDVSALPALTQALLDQGFSSPAVTRILGGNALRVLIQTLP